MHAVLQRDRIHSHAVPVQLADRLKHHAVLARIEILRCEDFRRSLNRFLIHQH